ncbi:MAG: hypothetical protein DRI57_11200 [Deltaproteobacteria bacterium]|nr:MAG: hypothetical protein DRI57_11200 [Deltaproteobacteria bacterium]
MKHSIPEKLTPSESSGEKLCHPLGKAPSPACEEAKASVSQIERKYRLLIDNLPSIVYVGHADGSVEFFDDRIQDLTGYSREEFLTKKVRRSDLIIENGEAESAKKTVKEALRTDRSYISEYKIRSKNGEIVWLEERGQVVCDENGKIEFIVGALLDITKHKSVKSP